MGSHRFLVESLFAVRNLRVFRGQNGSDVECHDLRLPNASDLWEEWLFGVLIQWVDVRENLQENVDFPMKNWIFL